MSKKKTGYFDWLTNKDNEGENTTSGGYFDWLNSEKGQSYVGESKIKKQKEHEYDKFVSKFNSEVEEYNKKVKNNEEKQKQLANDIAINMARFGAEDALNGKGNPYMNHAIDTSNLLYNQDEYRAAVAEIKKGKEYDQYLTDFPKISDYYNNDQLLRGYDSRKANGIKVMDDDIYNYVASAYDANKDDSSSEPVTIDDIAEEFNITYDQAEEYYTNFSNYIRRSEADLQDKANSAYRKDEEPAPTKVNAGYLPTAGVFNDVNDIDNREASLDWMHMPEKEDNSLLGSKYHTDEANSQYEYAKNAVQVWDSLPDDLKDKIDYAFGNNGANDEKIKENLLKYSGYSKEELESYNKISENYDKLQEAVDTYEFSEKVLGELSEEELTDLLDEVKESRKNKRGFGFRSEYLFPNKLKNKIAEKYGEDKAQDILDAADYIVGFSEKQELYEGFKDLLNSDNHLLSFAGAVGLHAADIAGSLTGGLGLIDTLGQKLSGSKIVNPYSVGHSYDVFSSALSQAQTETIDNSTWNFVFQTADSIAKSALMMAASSGTSSALGLGENVAKGIGFVGFGANAFNQAYMECIESGMGTDTAIQVATANGIFEGLFEELSFDKLLSLKKVDASSRKQLFKNLLSSSAVEGSEEFFTTTADWLAEYAIASDLSKQETLKRQLIQQGMDPDEADKQVMKEFWKEAALAFAGGFVSGGVHAGGKMAFDSYRVNKLSNSILEEGTDSVEEIRQAALDLDHDTEAYKIASEKTADEMTASDINSIIRGAMQSSATEGTIHDVLVEELSKTENISMEEAKEAVDGWIQGETAEEGKYQLSDEVAESILEENKSKTVGTTILNAAYKANSASEIKKDIAKAKKTDQKQLDRYVKNNGTIAAVDISSENEDEHKDVEIAKFIMVGKNNNIPVAVLANGDIMPLDSLAIKDENMAAVIQDVLTTENTYAVNTAREYYDGSIDTKNFSKAGIAFYNYGYAVAQGNKDITFDSIDVPALNQYRGIIQNDAYLNQMFSIGMNRANQELQAEEEKNEKKPEKKISRKENENAGKVTDKRNDGAGVDDQWNKLATAVAEATGLNIVLTDDIIGGKNTNGNFTAAFGRLTVNTTADYAYGTFIHELSEFGMSYNQKAMQQLVRSVLDFINTSKGSEYLNSALNDYKNAYRSTVESTKTFREAGDEYVFDVMAGVFMTESGMSDFYDFLYNNVSEDKRTGILQTLTDIFDFLVDKIKTFLGKTTNTSRKDGYKIALDKANELRNQWKNVIQGAIENYNGDFLPSGFEKYSERELQNFKNSNNIIIANSEKDISDYVREHVNTNSSKRIYIGKIGKKLSDRIKNDTGIELYGFNLAITNSFENKHDDKDKEAYQGRIAITPEIVSHIAEYINNYESVVLSGETKSGKPALKFTVNVDGKKEIIEYVSDKKHMLYLQTMYGWEIKKNSHPGANAIANATTPETSWDMNSSNSISSDSEKASNSVEVDSAGRELSEGQKKRYADVDPLLLDDKGRLKRYYHGSARVDRIGDVFLPERATSGPMAFFTDDPAVADNYAKDKADTSLSRDSKYDSYETQFTVDLDGEEYSVIDLWDKLPYSARREIKNRVPHITYNDDYEIVYDENVNNGNGYIADWSIREAKGNYLKLLVDEFLNGGDLYDQEAEFLNVLKLAGIDNAVYHDPNEKHEGVYEVYLNVKKALDTTNIPENVVDALRNSAEEAEVSEVDYAADMWDKTSTTPDMWIERFNKDIENGTTHAWTTIPDFVTKTLKEYGYDGISDVGGKYHSYSHQVVIPFESNQVKYIDNENPTDDPNMKYSVEVDKKIVNKLTGKEISKVTYSVLNKLDHGISVAPGVIYGLPEVLEGNEELKKILKEFSANYPEINIDVENDVGKSFTHLIDSEERIALREKIINELVNNGSVTFDENGNEVYNGEVRKDHRLDIVVGLPASGKSSSIVNPLSQFYKSKVIDSDIIKQMLPEFNGGWGAGLVHEESSIINRIIFEQVLESGNNFILPIIGGDPNFVYKRYIKNAILKGYDIHIHLNKLDNAKATSRLLKRFFSTGRFLNPSLVVEKGNKPTDSFNVLKERGVVDGYSEWNNDVEIGESPIPETFSDSEKEFVRYRTKSRTTGIGVGRESDEEISEGVKNSVEVDSIEGLKHSLNVPDGEADFWEKINSGEWEDNKWEDGSSTTNSNKYLSDAVSVLEEGAKVVGDVELDEKAINKMAREIKKYYMTTIDAKKIADSLTKVFSYMASTEDISYGTMLGIMKEIATPIIENSEDVSAETKELYDNVKSYLKANKISLSDEQKKEVAYAYGSYNNFRKSLMGTVTISKDGISLDSIWSELCGVAAGLDVSTVDADQGIALAEYLESIKPIKTNPFNQNKEQAAYDCAMDIYRRYFEYQAENTAMAKAEAKLEPIKIGIVNAMKSYKESTRENYKKAVREEYLKAKEEKNAKLKRLAETLEQIESDQESAFSNMDELTAELLEAEKVKYQERIKKLREQNEENVAKVKAANKQSRENERYRRNNTELKQSVRSAVNSLNSMLTSPNVNNHIKKSLVRPVIDVLESINLDTGKSKTMQEKLAKLAQVYESYKSDKTFEIDYDENLKNRIDELSIMFADRNYTELSNDELSKVLDIVRALKKQIQNANRLIQNAKVKDAYEAARTVVDEVETSHGVNTKIGEVFNKYNTWQLNAYREFRKLSGYNDDSVLMSLYDEFQQGELKQLSFQREANQLFEEVMQGSDNQKEMKRMLSTKEEDMVDVGLTDKNGNKVLVTRDMRMSLILHSLNQGNMNHVLGGGLTIPDMELYKKGKLTEAYTKGDTYRFVSYETALKYARANAKWAKDRSNQSLKAEADLARSEMEAEKQKAAASIDKLVNELSEWEKMYLEKAKVFFHEMTGKYINEVTEELRGYAVASVKNYFPIKTDPDFTRTEFAGLVMDASLEGWGNLKSRINAANPIMLEGLSNILLRQIDKTSNYIGYAIPVRDYDMITNKQFSDDRSGQTKSIRRSIKKTWSNYDYEFLVRFMKDIQGGRSTDSTFIDMLRGNFAGATLTANIGVAMKQAASYPTAAAVLGWGPLGKALKDVGKGFIKHGISELEEINPLLWNRTQGMSSQEIAYAKKSALYKNAPKWMKNISADLIQNVDTATVTTLEYASKYYVDNNFKELQQGSKEYWQKVSEVFTKVVTETQPNYTVLQRPEVLRNPNQFIKQLVMFKTQPLQNFGILYDAWHECNAMRKNLKANNSSDNQAKYKQAKKHLIRAISSQLSAAVTFSAMTIIANLAYHKNWKYDRDDDKDMWQEMLESIGTGVMSTLFGAFTFGDSLYQLIDEKVFGGTYYGLELNTLALFNDTKSGIDKIIDYHDKLSSAENEGAVNKYGLLLGNAYADVIKQACKFFGIPADNIVKTLESIFLYTSEVFNQEEIGSTSMPYDVYKTEGYAKKAYEALVAGDIDTYNELVNDIAKYKTGDNPINAAKNDVKKVLKQNYTSGKITKEETANILQQYYSMDSEKAALQIYEWENAFSGAYDGIHNVMDKLVKDPDDNSLYNSAREMCKELMANGKDAKDIANNIKSRYKDDYESASTSDRVKIKAAIVKVLNSIGYKTKKYNPSTFVDSWIK